MSRSCVNDSESVYSRLGGIPPLKKNEKTSMPDVYEILKLHSVPYDQYDHPAVFTTAEADRICQDIPGKQCKNLFLTNDKGTKYFLITIGHDKRADLKQLGQLLGQKGLRFASAERLQKYLGLTPGSVSPLGLINDTNKAVEFLIDGELLDQEKIYIHPNINTATLGIRVDDFTKLLQKLGYALKTITV